MPEATVSSVTTDHFGIDRILTCAEVAHALRCSKAHVSNIICGKVPRLPPLPIVRIGRRVLIRDESLAEWMRTVEAMTGSVR
jgi:hypothetical protein